MPIWKSYPYFWKPTLFFAAQLGRQRTLSLHFALKVKNCRIPHLFNEGEFFTPRVNSLSVMFLGPCVRLWFTALTNGAGLVTKCETNHSRRVPRKIKMATRTTKCFSGQRTKIEEGTYNSVAKTYEKKLFGISFFAFIAELLTTKINQVFWFRTCLTAV